MSEVFQTEMIIDSLKLHTMVQEEDMKNYFKQRLAIQLAHKLIETNRTRFFYTKLLDQDAVSLKAEVRL
jgi:hypothetical protein